MRQAVVLACHPCAETWHWPEWRSVATKYPMHDDFGTARLPSVLSEVSLTKVEARHGHPADSLALQGRRGPPQRLIGYITLRRQCFV